MKSHKYWSLGALFCMLGCIYSGIGNEPEFFRRGGKADHRADKAAVRQPVFRWLRNSPAGI